jgi:SAM-dependent methyltransferase
VSPLVIGTVEREDGDVVVEGVLHCSDAECRCEYPILDGIPILVHPIRDFVSANFLHLTARSDLSGAAESLIGDCAGAGSPYDVTRQHLSTYVHGHFGDLDPEETSAPDTSVLEALERGLGLLGENVGHPVLDVGCAAGRSALELAARTDGLVLGADVSVPMLRVAHDVLGSGRVRYARRRVGMAYDRRAFDVHFPGADRVDFWACDALALPFAPGAFRFVAAMNLLDSVRSPLDLLRSIESSLAPGGASVISSPYDWSPSATPPECWIGGHSDRGPDRGAAEPRLRGLLTPAEHPQGVPGLRIAGEIESVPWTVRAHERHVVTYGTHVLALRRTD